MSIEFPGFADPVADSQATFRAVLQAIACPGTIRTAGATLVPPPPLHQATAAVLLTLVDADTPLWLDPPLGSARDWIAFHCGCPMAAAPDTAAIVLAASLPPLASLQTGTDEAPEDGATVIVQVPALGAGARMTLSGPGLPHAVPFACSGLPDDFPARWSAMRPGYPRGIELILCAGMRVAVLPRGTDIRAA